MPSLNLPDGYTFLTDLKPEKFDGPAASLNDDFKLYGNGKTYAVKQIAAGSTQEAPNDVAFVIFDNAKREIISGAHCDLGLFDQSEKKRLTLNEFIAWEGRAIMPYLQNSRIDHYPQT